MSTFDSTKQGLPKIIQEIKDGKIQLPDFQRGWVWDDEHVRSLLISIARSFPIGAVMFLKTGNDKRFKFRLIENLPPLQNNPKPEHLVLDGQQRLTSLTQVLALPSPVQTFNEKKKKIQLYYYIDIEKAMEDETLETIESAFFSTGIDRKVKKFGREIVRDVSTTRKECENFCFPCNKILNPGDWAKNLHKYKPDKMSDYFNFEEKILRAFREYDIPIISLEKDTTKEAVCLVFEKVNTGGVTLSVFELVTASFAAEDFNLREDWYGSKQDKKEGREKKLKEEEILSTVEPTDFLQAVSLLHTYEKRKNDRDAGKEGKSAAAVSAKRSSILSLELGDYRKWADDVEEGFLLVARFLRKQCFFFSRDLPYRSQLVPLAAVLATIKGRWLEPRILDKLTRWYWCGVLGELYGGSIETRIANDIEDLLPWLVAEEGDEADSNQPRTITEATFQSYRLNTLRTRNSAAYKGINTLVIREGAKDFFWKETILGLDNDEHPLNIHHIFPRKWCTDRDIKRVVFDSIINKTPISRKANLMIGGKAPSSYLAIIQEDERVRLSNDEMDVILESHCIDADKLRADDFNGFLERRSNRLLDLIEGVTGKKVERGDYGEQENEDDSEDDTEDNFV